jgi:hypothetical protein
MNANEKVDHSVGVADHAAGKTTLDMYEALDSRSHKLEANSWMQGKE